MSILKALGEWIESRNVLRAEKKWRRDYEAKLDDVFGTHLSLLIAFSLSRGAKKITFGCPPGFQPSEKDRKEIEEEYAVWRGYWPDLPHFNSLYASDKLHRRDGPPVVPVWFEISGRWERQTPYPVISFVPMLSHICERIVAINSTLDHPQLAKWIEYTLPAAMFTQLDDDASAGVGDGPATCCWLACNSTRKDNLRHFVEVDFVLEENNAFTIELSGVRAEPQDVRLFWRECDSDAITSSCGFGAGLV
jgi:hypothetical protein